MITWPRVPLFDLTGWRVAPAEAVAARDFEEREQLRQLTFQISRDRKASAEAIPHDDSPRTQ